MLRIPKEDIGSVAELFTLSDQDRNTLLDSLRKVEPSGQVGTFIGSVGKLSGLSEETLSRLLMVLLNLCSAAHARDSSIDYFVGDDVASAFALTEDERIHTSGPQWDKVREFLSEALETNSLSATAKAMALVLAESHLFTFARIVSDIRLVFPKDPSTKPSAGMVIHSLKLNYLEDGERSAAEFVLDREDLLNLRKIIERALVKDQTLDKILQQIEVKRITPFASLEGQND